MFHVGDSIIYPAHGLAEVEAIEEKNICGQSVPFYILRVLKNNTAVMVPTQNEKKVGLRSVIKPADVPKVLGILRQRSSACYSQWHHRFNDNFEKLKSGSIFMAAEVLRDLAALKRRKNLAIKESRMMDNAWSLLTSEISFTQGSPLNEVEQTIREALDEGACPEPSPDAAIMN
ncbi:CarD family transcriptional regulator [bacterium]|nr:CarD family transcriptional regulator [candidate division CSSED10-310 bacterium]